MICSSGLRVPSKKRQKHVELTKPTNSSRTELERMVSTHSKAGKLSQEENCLQWLNMEYQSAGVKVGTDSSNLTLG